MKYMKTIKANALLLAGLVILTIAASVSCTSAATGTSNSEPTVCADTITVFLRADLMQKTMPDGRVVPMWGYAQDSSFGAGNGTVMSPGPAINLCEATTTLNIYLDNNLPEPTSIVINGQQGDLTPVRNLDGRLRSFTHETQPNNSAASIYTFTNLKHGTYMYQSGTHPAVQVQMGLSGAMTRKYDEFNAYPSVPLARQLTIVYQEVDPDLHDAVANGNYGPTRPRTSTINFHPKYLLLNGAPQVGDGIVLPPGAPGTLTLLRFINAGIASHSPVFSGLYAQVIAEDGNLYTYPKKLYSLLIPAGKTMDALVYSPTTSSGAFVADELISHM